MPKLTTVTFGSPLRPVEQVSATIDEERQQFVLAFATLPEDAFMLVMAAISGANPDQESLTIDARRKFRILRHLASDYCLQKVGRRGNAQQKS